MRWMRVTAVAAMAVLATAGLCGCTGTDDPTIPSAGGTPTDTAPAADPQAKELEFVACMRDQGIADMPDPVPGDTSGRSAVRYALDVMGKGSDAGFQAALDECLALLPPPPAPEPRSSDELEALHQFAQCMRDHGIADFPDPEGDDPRFIFVIGEGSPEPLPAVTIVDGTIAVNIGDPVVSAGWEACRPLFPPSTDGWTVGG